MVTSDGTLVRSMSKEALERQRDLEKRLVKAKSEEERQMVQREQNFYRVNLVYSHKEAKVVKYILGDNPAQVFLDMCKDVYKQKTLEMGKEDKKGGK